VAEIVNVCVRAVRRRIDAGFLVAHDFGGIIRIAESDLSHFVERSRGEWLLSSPRRGESSRHFGKDFLQFVDSPVNLRFFDHEWWRKADRVAMRVFR